MPASTISTFFIIWRVNYLGYVYHSIRTPCKTVNFLYLIYHVFLYGKSTFNGKNIGWSNLSVRKRCTCFYAKSPSWTSIWRVNGTRYFLTTIFRLNNDPHGYRGHYQTQPHHLFRKTTAGLLGLRASNNPVTRGDLRVISPLLRMVLGILAITCPALTVSASTIRRVPTGML